MFIDVFFALFLIYGLVTGYYRGFIRAVLSLVGIFLAILLGLKLGPYLGDFLERSFHLGPMFSLIIGIVLCFILILWGVRILSGTIEKGLRALSLNFINKFAGALILGAFMFLFYGWVVRFLDEASMISQEAKHTSKTYAYVARVPEYTDQLMTFVKPMVREVKDRLNEYQKGRDNQPEAPG
jgi:membrane protein required for colicin V production